MNNPNYSQWATYHNQPSDPTATPFGDGIPNLLKYVYDIDPTRPMQAADIAALPYTDMPVINGVPYFALVYRQSGLLDTSTVVVQLQSSPDLVNWNNVTPDLNTTTTNPSGTPAGDTTVVLGVRAYGSGQQFLRLNVTAP